MITQLALVGAVALRAVCGSSEPGCAVGSVGGFVRGVAGR